MLDVERVGEERLVKRVDRTNTDGKRRRGRSHRRRKDELKELMVRVLGREETSLRLIGSNCGLEGRSGYSW